MSQIVNDHMRAYYDRRAPEYDDWWLGTGLHASRERPGWAAEVAELVDLVHGLPPARVLDVACGTAFLTRHLRGQVVAIDQSPAMVEIAAARMPGATVLCAEAVPLPFADGTFDRIITGHFYGHLLPDERSRFVAEARRVADSLVVIDSAVREGVEAEQWQERVLNDGSRHQVYKRYFTGADLAAELERGEVLLDGRWFVAVASSA
ncbi:MAG: class I SAM-dependent methyltransferase [Gaiellales bacterium]